MSSDGKREGNHQKIRNCYAFAKVETQVCFWANFTNCVYDVYCYADLQTCMKIKYQSHSVFLLKSTNIRENIFLRYTWTKAEFEFGRLFRSPALILVANFVKSCVLLYKEKTTAPISPHMTHYHISYWSLKLRWFNACPTKLSSPCHCYL